jgi:uncharacterized protein (TIGR02647 family)
MNFNHDLLDEINLLMKFNLTTTLEGIKVHHNADPENISAALRLFDKQLVTQKDGGYLTDLGREVSEHLQAAHTILTSA